MTTPPTPRRKHSKGTPHRGIRIDDDLWLRVQAQAGVEGVSVSEVVRGLLRGWLSGRQDNEGDGNECQR